MLLLASLEFSICVFITATHRQLTPITYIPKSIKNQKRQTPEKGLALLKKDITNNLEPQKPVFIADSAGLGLKISNRNR
jgi:hypothetical protein